MIGRAPLLRRLAGEERGSAAIEYGIWASVLFCTMMGATDFGLWRAYQLRLNAAVDQAGMIAMRAPNGLAPDALRAFVQTAAALPGTVPTVRVTCNGTSATDVCSNTSRTYYCLSNTGTYQSAGVTAGATCSTPANTTTGYYIVITATYAFTPLVLPRKWLSGKSITDKLVLRVE